MLDKVDKEDRIANKKKAEEVVLKNSGKFTAKNSTSGAIPISSD